MCIGTRVRKKNQRFRHVLNFMNQVKIRAFCLFLAHTPSRTVPLVLCCYRRVKLVTAPFTWFTYRPFGSLSITFDFSCNRFSTTYRVSTAANRANNIHNLLKKKYAIVQGGHQSNTVDVNILATPRCRLAPPPAD